MALTFGLCVWFAQTYGTGTVTPPAFVLPPREEEKAPASPEQQQAETAREETLVEAAAQAAAQAAQQAPPRAERIARARANSRKRQISETETRALVDEQLRQVGWEADTDNLRYAKGTRPQKGRALAIAEWPMRLPDGRTGRVDYALFVGDTLYGIVEAKGKLEEIRDGHETRRAAILHKAFTGELTAKTEIGQEGLEALNKVLRTIAVVSIDSGTGGSSS